MRSSTFFLLLIATILPTVQGCSPKKTTVQPSAPQYWEFTSAAPELAVAGAPGGFVQAAHPPLPQVTKGAGSVMASPKIKLITYSSDTEASPFLAWLNAFAPSAELSTMITEYGAAAPIVLQVTAGVTAPTLISDTQIQQYISANLGGILGAADTNTIYMVTFPTSTIVSFNGTTSGDFCAIGYLSYHSSYFDAGSGKVIAYAVILRCGGFWGLDELNTISTASSHEIVEAITDPQNPSSIGYAGLAPAFNNWGAYMPGLEVGDMCEVFETSFYQPLDLNYHIQRTWSNAAAAAGHNPCIPAPIGAVYFNSVPVMSDTVSFIDPNTGVSTNTTGVSIPIGTSKTIALKLFSDAPTSGNWTVSAFEDPYLTVSGGNDVTISFDQTTGSNGTTLNLTIHVVQQDPNWLAEPVWIQSTLNGVKYYWPIIVGN